jgi:hypothetical protein
MNNPVDDDIQREMEQRALRNVRGLVDKMEDMQAHDSRTQRHYLVGIVLGALVVLLVLAGVLWIAGNRSRSEAYMIDASKTPPREAPH